jgi:glycosyltransferase involved in cell wall biosynthesis
MQPDLLPLVSAIIPVYNGAAFLAEAIESILAQTYPKHEIIVVDDGSSDRTREIAQSYPVIRYLHQAHAGTAAARNRGVENAKGLYLAFLDADDLWMPDKLALQVAAFQADPTLEMVSGHVEQFVNPGQEQAYSASALPIPGYSTIAILIKRSALGSVGRFLEEHETAETIGWFSSLIDRDQRVLVLPEVVAKRRIHGANSSLRNQAEKNRSMIRILKKSIERKRAIQRDKKNG